MSDTSRWRRWFWFTVAGAACGAVYGYIQMQAGVRYMVPLVSCLVLGAVCGLIIDIIRAGIDVARVAMRR